MKALLFGLIVGVFIGTLPGIRETTPWGKQAAVRQAAAIKAATVPTATPVPAPAGSWMYNDRPGALDQRGFNQKK